MIDFSRFFQRIQRRHRGGGSQFPFGQLFLLGVGIAFVTILSFGTIGVYQSWHEAREQARIAEDSYNELRARHDRIATSLKTLESPEGLEEELRTRFNVAREGEGVVVILDSSSDTEEGEKEGRERWWQKLFFWQ